VIGNRRPVFRTRLVGRDIKALVDLLRIGDDDLTIQLEREPKGKLRLSDPGRSYDDRNVQRAQ